MKNATFASFPICKHVYCMPVSPVFLNHPAPAGAAKLWQRRRVSGPGHVKRDSSLLSEILLMRLWYMP